MPEPLRILVSGASGRMGTTLAQLIANDPELVLAGGVDRDEGGPFDPAYGEVRAIAQAAELFTACDALIDFSAPEFLHRILAEQGGALAGRAIVVGTTGLGEREEAALEAMSRTAPVLTAANFSVGVNVLLSLVGQATRALGDEYDVEIVEAHHRRKEDAPSGTALALGKAVAEARGVDLAEVRRDGRSGRPGARTGPEIGFHAVRGGSLVGEHEVMFIGERDRIEITHRAGDRSLFAAGALRAARWLAGKPAGRYQMRDVLGLE